MRDKLVRDIKRKFGPVFGSEQLKAQRQEIVTNALDRYDEEIQNGASEADAYRTAMNSIGNMKSLKESIGWQDKRNFWVTFIIIALSVLLLSVSAVVSAYYKYWWFFIGMLIAVVLVGTAIWRLATGNHRSVVPHIIAIVIGGQILLFTGIFTYLGCSVMIDNMHLHSQLKTLNNNLTEHIDHVEFIAYVQITEIDCYTKDDKSDVFEYTVLETIASGSQEAILKDISALEYDYMLFGHPRLAKNAYGFLIKYTDASSDLLYVFYWEDGYAVVRKCDVGIIVDYYIPRCTIAQWNRLLKKYVKGIYD